MVHYTKEQGERANKLLKEFSDISGIEKHELVYALIDTNDKYLCDRTILTKYENFGELLQFILDS